MEIKRKLKINNKFGLHSRPASQIVNLAKKFNSELLLYRQDQETEKADCQSIISLLMLGANHGTELILSGKGNDANIAIQEIAEYFERNFDEIA